MSENFAYSHMNKPGRTRTGYVGEALPGVEVRISDIGEVLVKSPATMMGYYKDEEKTAEAFTEDGFLRTGDKGEIDEMGRLKLTEIGRASCREREGDAALGVLVRRKGTRTRPM